MGAAEEVIDAMHEQIAALPLAEREVIVLFYLQELTLDDIARVIDAPIGTVKSRLFRARNALRHLLISKGIER
jgi:RNA polymerase sigma factor (sigma-70 family)